MAERESTLENTLPDDIERGQQAIPCECGGYCDKVKATPEEAEAFGCWRDTMFGSGCCAVAFVCRICGKRYHGYQPAPEMGY